MDAVDFIKTRRLICEKLACQDCGLSAHNNRIKMGCHVFIKECPEEAVKIVEQWSKERRKEHPVKTRQSEFLRYYPNAKINKSTGALTICPTHLFGGCCEDYAETAITCDNCCERFWLESVEEK